MFNTIQDKINYDLALIYAKTKLDEAISDNRFDDSRAPAEIEKLEYLQVAFANAWNYYQNVDNDE